VRGFDNPWSDSRTFKIDVQESTPGKKRGDYNLIFCVVLNFVIRNKIKERTLRAYGCYG
jgi:hypothetical protein